MYALDNEHKEYLLCCSMAAKRAKAVEYQLTGKELNNHEERKNHLSKNGWHSLKTSEQLDITSDGYFGVAYYKTNKTSQVEIVIAHRGTCFDEWGNILADIEIAQQGYPKILKTAQDYIYKLFSSDIFNSHNFDQQLTVNKHKVTRIIFTGFSLGGFLAGACAALCSLSYAYAVTFDAPGVAYLEFPEKDKKVSRFINYVTVPNLVNTCNKYFGEIRKLESIHLLLPTESEIVFKIENFTDLGFTESIDSKKPEQPTLIDQMENSVLKLIERTKKVTAANQAIQQILETLQSHNLDKLIDLLNKDALSYKYISQWPIAKNQFIYGKSPSRDFGSLPFISIDTPIGFFLNMSSIVLQGVKQCYAEILWIFTKQSNDDGDVVGVIGIEHARENTFSYQGIEYTSNHSAMFSSSASIMPSMPEILESRDTSRICTLSLANFLAT